MDTGNNTSKFSKQIEDFWNMSSDEEIFDNSNLKKAVPSPTHKEPSSAVVPACQPDSKKNSPCSSRSNASLFDIEPRSSFDNSPSTSIMNILQDVINIPTPIPSSGNCSGQDCNGELCIEHVQSKTVTISPISRKRIATRKDTDNIKRKCVRNIARTFVQTHQSVTPSSDVSPSPSVAPIVYSSDEESDQEPDFVPQSDESDEEDDDSDAASMVPSPRGEKKQLKGRNEWLQNKRKRLKNLGQEYCTKEGVTVPEKEMKPSCQCRLKCYEKISEIERIRLFTKFWELGDRQKQWAYLVKYTQKAPKTRCLNQDTPNNRKFTYKYNLPVVGNSDDLQVSTVSVCKTMYINTLAVSDRMIRTAWDKYDGSTEIEEDKRGRHQKHKSVINESMTQGVVEHVNALAPVESHHLRKKTTKLYLEGAPTIPRMFQLYNEWFDPEKYNTKAKTERQYREIVKDKFNLGRFIPKKDQCKTCHEFNNKKNPTEADKEAQNKHQENKLLARNKKDKDKKDSIESNGKILAAVFDFEKILVCPHAKVSLLYYKRKLACLNFTVFDMGTKKAVCYMWDETVAGRGSNEVSSCLLDYIDKHVEKGVQEFRFWSDNCAGQNRNRIVFFLYAYAANKHNIDISHTFLEVGHTQNEGDSVHSTIERASSLRTIYSPEEWKLLVRWARAPDQEPYLVKSMEQGDFIDFKKQINDRFWQKNTDGEKISWKSIREISVTKTDPFTLKFKYSLKENYQSVIVRNRTRQQIAPIVLEKAYNNGPLPLTSAKYNDLISLCKQGVIPDEYVSFYEQLPNKNAIGNRSDQDPHHFTDDDDSD